VVNLYNHALNLYSNKMIKIDVKYIPKVITKMIVGGIITLLRKNTSKIKQFIKIVKL